MKLKGTRLVVLMVLAIVFMAALLSCTLEMSPGNGALEIHIGGASRGINWLPGIDMVIDTYSITGTGPNPGDRFLEEGFPGGSFTKEVLAAGDWEITIDGYNEDGIQVGTTTISVTVRTSQTTQVTASLSPLTGVGNLEVSASWIDSKNLLTNPKAYVLIKDKQGNVIPIFQHLIELTVHEGGKSAAGLITGIPTGWYEVSVNLYEGIPENDAEIVWQDVYTLRIVKDETTEGVAVIPEEEILFGVGRISIIIEEEMENPFDVFFTDLPEVVKEEESVIAVATGTYGDDATYRWYVNGVRQETNINSFVFVPNSAGFYNISLLVSSGNMVGGHRESITVLQATEEVASDLAALKIGYAEGEHAEYVLNDIVFSTSGAHGTRITWESSDTTHISSTGTVTRPAYSEGDVQVQLTATVERGTVQETKTFSINVIKLPQTDAEAVAVDKTSLEIGFAGLDSAHTVTQDVTLARSGDSGTTISWESSAPDTITTAGVVTSPDYTGGSDVQVILTATISKGGVSETKTFTLTVKILLQEQTVTFVSNGGNTLEPQTVYWGRLVEVPESPTKVGYSFEGWFVDSELTDQWDFAQDYVNGDVILYAKWGDGYQISFNSQGGLPATPLTMTVGYGVAYDRGL